MERRMVYFDLQGLFLKEERGDVGNDLEIECRQVGYRVEKCVFFPPLPSSCSDLGKRYEQYGSYHTASNYTPRGCCACC